MTANGFCGCPVPGDAVVAPPPHALSPGESPGPPLGLVYRFLQAALPVQMAQDLPGTRGPGRPSSTAARLEAGAPSSTKPAVDHPRQPLPDAPGHHRPRQPDPARRHFVAG